MKTLETRIAGVEARMFPEAEKPYILYVVHETDSEFQQDAIRERAIAEYEYRHGVEVDPDNVGFFKLIVCYTSRYAREASEVS
jgi:hypothetical protein